MSQPARPRLTGLRSRSPRAGALAGILFSLLMGTYYLLIRTSVPADPTASADWMEQEGGKVRLALSLVPFAGISFLWFIGVVRDRIGRSEDQFFSTVFFGSGLLFLAMVFASSAVGSGLLASYEAVPEEVLDSGLYTFGREVTYRASNVFALRMSGVFMISLGTIWVRTRTMPRWLAVLTYVTALVLLFSVSFSLWLSLLFPAWVLLVSIYIMILNFRGRESLLGQDADPIAT